VGRSLLDPRSRDWSIVDLAFVAAEDARPRGDDGAAGQRGQE